MHKSLILAILILYSAQSFAEKIFIAQAGIEKKVKSNYKSKSGHLGECVELALKNISPKSLEVVIPAGTLLENNDSYSQRLIVVRELIVNLAPNQFKTHLLYTMCTQSHKASPQMGSFFFVQNVENKNLSTLAELISQKNYFNSESQAAVWAMENKTSPFGITGSDSTQIKSLRTVLFQSFGAKLINKDSVIWDGKKRNLLYNQNQSNFKSFSFSGSVEVYLEKKTKLTYILSDALGQIIYHYEKDKEFEIGFHSLRYAHNYFSDSSHTYFVKIYKGDKLWKEKKVNPTELPLKTVKIQLQKTIQASFKEAGLASIEILDSLGNIYTNIFENKNVSTGVNTFQFSKEFSKPLYVHQLMIRLKDKNEKIIKTEPLNLSPRQEIMVKASGVFPFKITLETEFTLGVYDSKDQMVMEYYTKLMKPGVYKQNFTFIYSKYSAEKYYIKIKEAGRVVLDEMALQ